MAINSLSRILLPSSLRFQLGVRQNKNLIMVNNFFPLSRVTNSPSSKNRYFTSTSTLWTTAHVFSRIIDLVAATWATGHPRIRQRHSTQVVNDFKTRTNRSHLLICPPYTLFTSFSSLCFFPIFFSSFFILKKFHKIIVGRYLPK